MTSPHSKAYDQKPRSVEEGVRVLELLKKIKGLGLSGSKAPGLTTLAERKAPGLETTLAERIERVRALKVQGLVMETDPKARGAIAELQAAVRTALAEQYGAEPYIVEMKASAVRPRLYIVLCVEIPYLTSIRAG